MNKLWQYGLIIFIVAMVASCTPKTSQRKPGKHSSQKITGLKKPKAPDKTKNSEEYFVKQAEEILEDSEKNEKERLKAQRKQAEQGYAQEKENAEAAEKDNKRPRKINTGRFTFY